MQIILDTCKCDEIQANVNSTSRSYMLIHPIISFQFINTCENNNRAFFLLPQKILNKLFPNSTNIHCKSLIEKYKTWNESLYHFFKT
jgi:hypothetical protein